MIRGEGESVTFYCRVLNETNGTQVPTEWFIERRDAGSPQTIISGQSNFNITGEPLPNPAGQTSSVWDPYLKKNIEAIEQVQNLL